LKQKTNQNNFVKHISLKLWMLFFSILLVDQLLKLWVKTNLSIGDEIVILNWFSLYFVENNGFAFGWEFFGVWGKFFLTFFRIIFVGFIFNWFVGLVKDRVYFGVLVGFVLILGGAIGNIIDSVFYGVLFDYAPLFFGRVVDMFYFPIVSGFYPSWVPFLGGEDFVFFRFIFNIADSSITIGAFLLLIFYNKIPLK
tara:strand:+ start:2419 stop:3006 length:588 start_codon:yes stop_codon:yes gene_type:complete